ncbi:LamG-like jellyroll fold domain-containing protein [Halosegnis longus]|uniref:LamG-like jellyroll fold domain-containing protein n=1 Tax=Halosegnis longus TaxID=2216012 RepID=UPI00129E24A2|nr:LamG-like jellyroll fold domain-containing protein [Halosegnis longus]
MTELTINWSDFSDNEDGFRVYRSTSSGTTTADYTQIADVAPNTASYTDTGRTKGETYYYRVEAYTEHTTSLSDEVSAVITPNSVSSLTATGGDRVVDLSWSEGAGNNSGHRVYAADVSGSSTADYTQIADLAAGTTSYSDTRTLQDGEKYFYRVETYYSGKTALSQESVAVTDIRSPTVDSLDYISDDQLDLSVTHDSNYGNLHVQINRDSNGYVNPTGGQVYPSNGGTYTYGPNSDTPYEQQVGIDSSFKFRVRTETEHRQSSWVESSTVYTSPIPPHNPSVSRYSATEINVSWTDNSDIADKTALFYRKDTGNGYGNWNYAGDGASITGVSKGSEQSVLLSASDQFWLGEDMRVQIKLRHEHFSSNRDSSFIHSDYGNNNNVFFEDNFESGDLSAWDSTNLGGNAGVKNNSEHPDLNLNGSDEGSHHFYGEGINDSEATYLQKDLGDLSNEKNVIVKCAFSVGSLDNGTENIGVSWYDGSSWQSLEHFNWEYNKQGWFEVSLLVDSSLLSTDNKVRVGTTTTSAGMFGGDHFAVDRVVVSDILHEYTKPAQPTNPTSDTSIAREITIDWDDNRSLSNGSPEWFGRTHNSGNGFTKYFDNPPHTWDGLLDGEKYEWRPSVVYPQDRRGSTDNWWRANGPTVTATTKLPALSDLSISDVDTNSAVVGATDNANNRDGYRVFKGRDGHLEFDPSQNQHVITPLQPSDIGVDGDSPKTVIATVNTSNTNKSNRAVWEFGNQGTSGEEFSFRRTDYSESDGFSWRAQFWSGDLNFTGGRLNEDITIALTYGEGTSEAYINGSSKGDLNRVLNTQDGQSFRLGHWSGKEYWDGDIKDVKVYDRRLSSSEVSADAEGELINDGLQMWLPLNDGSGNTAEDYINNYDGDLINSPTWVGGGPIEQDGADIAPVDFPRYWDISQYGGDVEVLGSYEGYEDVVQLDRVDGRFDDLFSGQFKQSDFPDFEGDGNYVHIGFYAKWDQVVGWGTGFGRGEWVVKPDPDPNKYQYYEARSDGQNGEYFRMYYSKQDSGPAVYVAEPDIWKEGVDPPYRTIEHTIDGLPEGEAYVTRMSTFTEHTETFDQ